MHYKLVQCFLLKNYNFCSSNGILILQNTGVDNFYAQKDEIDKNTLLCIFQLSYSLKNRSASILKEFKKVLSSRKFIAKSK